MSPIALVGEAAPSSEIRISTSSQTSPWSALRIPDLFIDAETAIIFFALPRGYIVWGDSLNSEDAEDQRPRSTHETGMSTTVFPAARIVRLTIRFCFAPTNSSPSKRSTA